jgi:hypothetical protein
MDVIFCSTLENGNQAQLQEVIKTVLPKQDTGIHGSIESFSKALSKPWFESRIAVLYPATGDDLTALLSIRDLLEGTRIVLILPDRNEETVKKGLKLYPRFYSYADGDFSVVAAVLDKMIKKTKKRDRKAGE